MMGLLSKLAWSNLKNNRQLYFPFALATVVSSAIFYANSVVLKNRAQELGLYGILGLTKSNLVKMHAIESLIFAFFYSEFGSRLRDSFR